MSQRLWSQRFFKSGYFLIFCMLQINLLIFDGCFQTKSIEDLLQSSIDTLEQESGDWENTLEQLVYDLDNISGSSAAAIRAEVETLLERGLAATSQTMFCSVDFIGNRMRKSLIRIRADYLGVDSGLEDPEPYICMLEPTSVDLSLDQSQRKKITLTGYDFDLSETDYCVIVQDAGGVERQVTDRLSIGTHYSMILDISSGSQIFTNTTQKIIIKWRERLLSTIAVLQPSATTIQATIGERMFYPPHVGGDREFDGHGPDVFHRIQIFVENKRIWTRITMTAIETKKDWTKADGYKDFDLYFPPAGQSIVGCDTVPVSVGGGAFYDYPIGDRYLYTDSNKLEDCFPIGEQGPIRRICCMGDASGDDAGIKTYMKVEFNAFKIRLINDI